jgi:hypothetical protein
MVESLVKGMFYIEELREGTLNAFYVRGLSFAVSGNGGHTVLTIF